MNADSTLRWGILATGAIADQFAADFARLATDPPGTHPDGPRNELVAVASRTGERAQQFADKFGIGRAHASYADLAADDDVDIVYIATPQSTHCADAIAMLDAGKHVLCEKPLAINAAEVERMHDAARRNDRFLMEAIWTRFLPPYLALRRLLDDGRIGTPRLVDVSFGISIDSASDHRLNDAARGGGSLLDLGIYPLQLATFVLGDVTAVSATGDLDPRGVDNSMYAVLTHAADRHAVCKSSIRMTLDNTARITGSDGAIELPAPMHHPQSLTVVSGGGDVETIDTPFEGGLRFQVPAVATDIAAGRRENAVLPWSASRHLAGVMDDIRAQIGLRFASDG